MSIYSVYDRTTGVIAFAVLCKNGDRLQGIVPEGHGCILGDYDGLSQRVDVETFQVVDYQPRRPSENHQWNSQAKRWVYVKTDADIAAEVRQKRDQMFAAGDRAIIRAVRRGEPIPPAWAQYQQQLADIPQQAGFPRDVAWPVVPE
jgi:hypothetical protein